MTTSLTVGRFEPLKHADFRRLWTAALVSELGDAVGRIALTILVLEESGSALLTGSVVALYAVPFLGLGQWLTARVAALSRRRVLVAADIVRAVCFGAMVLPIGVYPRLGLLLVASIATPPFEAVAQALVTKSVPEHLIDMAAGLRTASIELTFVVGFAAGGLAAELADPRVVIGFDALTFLVSAVIVARVGSGAVPVRLTERVRTGDGLRAIRADPVCRRVLVLTAASFSCMLVPETLVAVYAEERVPDVEGMTGALASLTAVGVIAATLLRRPERDGALLRHASLLVLGGGVVAAIALALPDGVPTAAVAFVAVGPVLAIRVHAYTLYSRRIDDALLPSALSIATGAISASYLVAGLGGGALANAFSAEAASLGAAVLATLVGLTALVRSSGSG
jgi:hypothetical protein